MKLFLDQDVYHKIYVFLKENNFDVIRAKDLNLDRAGDDIILSESFKRDRILITKDKGFGSLVFFSRMKSAGVILLRLHPKDTEKIQKILLEVLTKYSQNQLKGTFITIEPDKYRIRHIVF